MTKFRLRVHSAPTTNQISTVCPVRNVNNFDCQHNAYHKKKWAIRMSNINMKNTWKQRSKPRRMQISSSNIITVRRFQGFISEAALRETSSSQKKTRIHKRRVVPLRTSCCNALWIFNCLRK